MGKKLQGWYARRCWHVAMACGFLTVGSTMCYAQIEAAGAAADTVVKVADKSPLLAACWIMAAVTCLAMYFAHRQMLINAAAQEAMRFMAEEHARSYARIVDNLNARPCIRDRGDVPDNHNLIH